MSTIETPRARVLDEWYAWPAEVDWAFYGRMLRLRGERRLPRMLYLDGELFLITPSMPHEERKERLGRFVHEVVAGLAITYRPTGSTTWRRASRRGGVEGDLTFYIASVGRIRGKSKVDLRVDPPPDLAIEVVYSHDATDALEVYRRLGVPEVWIATERGFEILGLDTTGPEPRYLSRSSSIALPMLHVDEIAGWIDRPAPEDDETRWTLELRRWVAETLAPRH